MYLTLVIIAIRIEDMTAVTKDEIWWDKVRRTNYDLGLLPYSITGQNVVNGKITYQEAIPIANSIKYRHEKTNYDSLLEQGMSKWDARYNMEEVSDYDEDIDIITSSINIESPRKNPQEAIERLKRVLGL